MIDLNQIQAGLFFQFPNYGFRYIFIVFYQPCRKTIFVIPERGPELFGDEETCPGLYLVVKGEVSIEQQQAGNSSNSKELVRLGPGQPFAVTTLFGSNWATIKARVIEDSLLLRIASEEFCAIAKEHPGIALEVCRVLSERMVGVLEHWGQCNQQSEEKSWNKKE